MVREAVVQSQVELFQRLKKMVLDAALLNNQHYRVRIKSKVENSREWSSAFPTLYIYIYKRRKKIQKEERDGLRQDASKGRNKKGGRCWTK